MIGCIRRTFSSRVLVWVRGHVFVYVRGGDRRGVTKWGREWKYICIVLSPAIQIVGTD
jgi:hypothetical protein